ncbi:hypothetical protein LCGC14_0991760, partial [marine sediment metagenome]
MEHFNFIDRFSWSKFKISWLVKRKDFTDSFCSFKLKYNITPKQFQTLKKYNM